VRICSANVLHGLDVRRLSRGVPPGPAAVDLDAVADWLRPLDADVIALQEVDLHLARSGGVDQVAALAERLGHAWAAGPALAGDPEVRWEEVPPDGLAPGAPGYGVGLLSRVGLHDVVRTRLPHGAAGTREPGATPTNPGVDGEPRVVLSMTTDDGLRISTTHLSYMPWRAVPQLGAAMAAAAEGADGAAVLVGDLNLPMWGGWLALHGRGLHPWGWPAAATTAHGWVHLPGQATYPSWRPRLQLDQAYVRRLPRQAVCGVGPAGPSDHLPLLLQL
jgi:endonuclease/exonuclease/phosphatase family metal-dependent hydrolase